MTQQASGGDNRTPGKTIGQVKYADGQATAPGGEKAPLSDKGRAQHSQQEGPAAYAPHEDSADASTSRDPATKKKGES